MQIHTPDTNILFESSIMDSLKNITCPNILASVRHRCCPFNLTNFCDVIAEVVQNADPISNGMHPSLASRLAATVLKVRFHNFLRFLNTDKMAIFELNLCIFVFD